MPRVSRRQPYALRHTFASFALDAGISIFELARFMGTEVRIIDRTYGHLMPGSEDRARAKLDERAARELAETKASHG
jgi:integrase